MYSFPILNQSTVPWQGFQSSSIASWPAYKFLMIQARWSGIPISLRIFHCLLWPTQSGLSIVKGAEVDVFLELSCFFYDPVDVVSLISGSSAFSKSSLNIWNLSVDILLKPSLKDFEHDLASMWNEHNCMVVWRFFGIALLCDWNENWPFSVLWPLLSFPHLLVYWVQHFNSIMLWN